MAGKAKSHRGARFEEHYRAALVDYIENSGESALGRAYELGRSAMAEGKTLHEMAALHHQALAEMVSQAKEAKFRKQLLKTGAAFLAESMAPYEMAHRGFQDAVKALRHMNETLEEEIKRIAYAVHDEAGQLLVAVHIALAELASSSPAPQRQQIGRIKELLKRVENELRRYSHELRPTILDDLGWLAAIRFLADSVSKRTGIPIQVRTKISGRLPGAQETALYRIVQEALTNAMKHAKAKEIRIDVSKEKQGLCCRIQDDGVGFDLRGAQSSRKRRGLGLIGIQERLNALGGILSIDSAPGCGTTLFIRLPVEVKDADSYRSR
jgi:two-component system, NarL family, sensor histidine kinase UhpB